MDIAGVCAEGYFIDEKDTDNFILQIRKEIFMSKKSRINIKELFFKLKKEALYKKFNFLAY